MYLILLEKSIVWLENRQNKSFYLHNIYIWSYLRESIFRFFYFYIDRNTVHKCIKSLIILHNEDIFWYKMPDSFTYWIQYITACQRPSLWLQELKYFKQLDVFIKSCTFIHQSLIKIFDSIAKTILFWSVKVLHLFRRVHFFYFEPIR